MIAYYDSYFIDSTLFFDHIKNYGISKQGLNGWGAFELQGDTIKAIIYYTFFGDPIRRTHKLQTHFEGVIQNRDTIVGWHIVEPYPKVAPMGEPEIEALKKPRNMYFKSVPMTGVVDPQQAWIDEFRHR